MPNINFCHTYLVLPSVAAPLLATTEANSTHPLFFPLRAHNHASYDDDDCRSPPAACLLDLRPLARRGFCSPVNSHALPSRAHNPPYVLTRRENVKG